MKLFSNAQQRYRNLPLPIKATLWFTVCNVCLRGINAITMPLFTRLLSEEEYGRLSLFQSYETVILTLATWQIELGAYQKGLFKYKDETELFGISTLGLINTLTILCFAFMMLFDKMIRRFTGFSAGSMKMLFVYLLILPAYNCWLVRQRAAYRYRSAVVVTLIYSLISIAFPCVALLCIERTANIKFQASLLGFLVVGIIFYIPAAKYWKLLHCGERVREYWSFLLRYSAPLVLHALSYLVLAQADRIMIGRMVGNAQVAYYSIAYNVANALSLLQGSINQVLVPWYYQMLEGKRYSRIRQVTNFILYGIGVLVVFFALVSPEIIKILFPPDYQESVWCIPPVVASVYFMLLYGVFVNIETYYERTKYVMYVSTVCAGLNVILNYFGIRWFGYIACAYTTLFCYVLFAMGHAFFMRRTAISELPGVKLFNMRMIFGISSAVIVLCVGTTVIYPYPWLRYGMLALAGGALIARRRWIQEQIAQVMGEKNNGRATKVS